MGTGLDRSEFLHLHVDERIFLLEAIAHHFNDGAFHGAENAELSFLFGLGDNLVMARLEEIPFRLCVLLRLE